MPIPESLERRLRLPVVAAPMFLISGPALVTACCRAGVVGTFPALNARSTAIYGDWLEEIAQAVGDSGTPPGETAAPVPDASPPGAARPQTTGQRPAPCGVNLIVHRSNPRLAADLEVTVARRVPLVITSLGAAREVVEAVHGYGGLVFHDVISLRHAEKAAEAGVDGIIAVAAGAGGHAGTLSPFALVQEIRGIFAGTILLGGAIGTGAQVAAARAMGADLAYMGSRFIATRESLASPAQKEMMLTARADDILYTPDISGVAANFLRPSIAAAGLDPDNLPPHGGLDMAGEARAWKNIWSAGHGVGAIRDLPGAGALCARLAGEYRAAVARLAADRFATPGEHGT